MHRRAAIVSILRRTAAGLLLAVAGLACAEPASPPPPEPEASGPAASQPQADLAPAPVKTAAIVTPPTPTSDPVPAPATGATTGTAAVDAEIPEAFREPKDGWPKEFKTKYTQNVTVKGISDDPKEAHYDIWVPEKYDPKTAAPLVIVLHGGPGGKAIALASVLAMGLAEQGAISVYPQALKNDQMLEWNYPHEGAFLLAIVRQVAQQYHIDPRRIYLMGHSMGGGGAWHNGAIMHELWAGIAPLSGWYGPTPSPPVELLKDMPTYIIHGDKDMNVLVQRSQLAVAEFKRMGKTDYVYKELAGVGHQEYLSKDPGRKELMPMAKWLLEQKRAKPADLDAAQQGLAKWGKQFHWTPEGGPLGKYVDSDAKPETKPESSPKNAPKANSNEKRGDQSKE